MSVTRPVQISLTEQQPDDAFGRRWPRLDGVDLLRGLAILFVLLANAPGQQRDFQTFYLVLTECPEHRYTRTMKLDFGHVKAIADAIATLFCPHVEVVVHDAASGRIAHISNALSKRRVGDDSLMSEDHMLRDVKTLSASYEKTNWNGHRMRSITVALRTASGKPLAYLCINHDREAVVAAKDALATLLTASNNGAAPAALFEIDWREQINEFVSDYFRERSLTRSGMRARDLDELIEALARRGFLEIRTAAPYIARVLGCSRAALYARLRDIRGGKASTSESRRARLQSH